jgi:hypothetical protein
MNTQTLIFYPGGCYGTFFEWVFNFLDGNVTEMPFTQSGSSHKFTGNLLFPNTRLFNHIDSAEQLKFCRTHPGIFENQQGIPYDRTLQQNIDFLKNHFDKIIVLSYDQESMLWRDNNITDKIPAAGNWINRNSINLDVKFLNSLGWNKSSIHDFDIWELRELLSSYWFTLDEGLIASWKTVASTNKDLLHISITDLRNQFVNVILKAAEYAGIKINDECVTKLEEVYQQWLPLQKQINKDSLCSKIVKSLVEKEYFDWSDTALSSIDEAWIQKKLHDQKIGIKCDRLNVFPTNTDDFIPLLKSLE